REREQAALARFLDQLRIHALDSLPLAIAEGIDHETVENGAFRTKAVWGFRRQSMRQIARRQQNDRPTEQALMEPGSEIEEAGEGPAAETQKHAAVVRHCLRQRREPHRPPVIQRVSP